MTRDRAAFWIVKLSTFYVPVGLAMGMAGVPDWIVLLPIFLIAAPAGMYLAIWKCPHCRRPVYTVESLQKAKDGLGDFKPGQASPCPNCGRPI